MDGLREILAANVARGAAWLDANWPRWFKALDVKKLDIANGCKCILGQRYGVFCYAPESVRIRAVELGFSLFTTDPCYDQGMRLLTAAWRDLILARRNPVELPEQPVPAEHKQRQEATAT